MVDGWMSEWKEERKRRKEREENEGGKPARKDERREIDGRN